jgi:hypothetical protein
MVMTFILALRMKKPFTAVFPFPIGTGFMMTFMASQNCHMSSVLYFFFSLQTSLLMYSYFMDRPSRQAQTDTGCAE